MEEPAPLASLAAGEREIERGLGLTAFHERAAGRARVFEQGQVDPADGLLQLAVGGENELEGLLRQERLCHAANLAARLVPCWRVFDIGRFPTAESLYSLVGSR